MLNERERPPSRARALALVALGLGSLVLSSVIYLLATDIGPSEIVSRELGGRNQTLPPPAGTTAAVRWDFLFIAGYGLALWLGTTLARRLFWTRQASGFASFSRGAVVVTVLADVIENVLLLVGLGPATGETQARLLDAAAATAIVKFSALLPAAVCALVGVGTTVHRALRRPHEPVPEEDRVRMPPPQEGRPYPPDGLATAAIGQGIDAEPRQSTVDASRPALLGEARWRKAFFVPGCPVDRRDGAPVTGFCLSGGGIRSASVAMGALQTLRPELRSADYLVSVSGGGFTAGALVQALTGAGDRYVDRPDVPVHAPKSAYAEGSAEFDHLRRNSSYLASTPTQMLRALGVLGRGLLATLTLIFAPAVVLGVLTAWFYHFVPLARLPLLPGNRPSLANPVGVRGDMWAAGDFYVSTSALLSVGAVAALALLAWLFLVWTTYLGRSRRADRIGNGSYRLSVFLSSLTVLVAVVALGVPFVVWVAGQTMAALRPSTGLTIVGPVGLVILTYLSSLAAMLWRKRKTITKRVAGLRKAPGSSTAVPTGALQLLLVIVTVAVLVAAWLLLFGVAVSATATDLSERHSVGSLWLAFGLAFVVLALGALLDESSLSLHPFYRKRLAKAFATRVVRRDHGEENPEEEETTSSTFAVPYHSAEGTTLSSYGKVAKEAEPFPEVVFAAAANLGHDHTPPGLNSVSFTMNADWVGGPDVGWVPTKAVERRASDRLGRDLTVQAAVAISGAAFASAMGRFARWYQILLAVSGARLGTWLPNPTFLHRLDGAADDWALPRLPCIRRMSYLLRELFNLHPLEERLLHVTDGGHYENLGLVELLRRRCRLIYCIDSGGDRPPTAKGLAQALTLAEAELGVKVALDHPFDAEPGIGTKLKPEDPLAALNAGLVTNPVITGTITYPAASGLDPEQRTGVLVVARALLWPELSYPLLSYATQNLVFPRDSTGDQWFNDGQFCAYTELGRKLGERAREAMQRKRSQLPL